VRLYFVPFHASKGGYIEEYKKLSLALCCQAAYSQRKNLPHSPTDGAMGYTSSIQALTKGRGFFKSLCPYDNEYGWTQS